MMLCPPVSIRAADLLTRDLLSHYSPVVLALLLSGPRAQQVIRAFVLDLQHPLKCEVTDAAAIEAIRWTSAEQLRSCLAHVKHDSKLKKGVLLAPLEPKGNANSFCPRCDCQFTIGSGECPDCPGVALVVFSKQATSDLTVTV